MTDPIATTRQGTVRGFERRALLYFRGIPYARPPVGDLRFRAPEPPEPWEGVRDATEYGPNSLQSSIASDIPLPPQPRRPMSEDCLYLNVVTPGLSGSRPVMVWIHGGGFTTGSGADFAGRQLAERGVVVVAMNYRLGALGSLALPALADRKGRFTNFGLRDQIAALRWVHDNIASFGGDPDNVTIFGESAGGLSVGSLLGSPEAKGLFHRAIPQSGAGHQARPADEALSASEQFCELLGVRPDDPAALRAASPEAILEVSGAVELSAGLARMRARKPWSMAHTPVIDGQCLLALPIEGLRRGHGSAVPVMAGWTADEFKLFEPTWENGAPSADELESHFGEFGPPRPMHRAYLDARAARGDSTAPGDVWSAALADWMFRVPADRLLEANATAGRPTYGYVFTWESPVEGLGACHSLDVLFVTGTYTLAPDFAGSGPAADALANTMMDAWVAFATNGDPSTPSLHWPRFETDTRPIMVLGERCHMVEGWHEEERRAWDGVIP
ncbi:MAG: carboxylesterase family protein [Dehalococcoidia bacterium]|nr:carboxylesterase family protein [Dehalococcoidia bacterium]